MANSLANTSGLMLALDVPDALLAENIVANNAKFIDAIKLGTMILTSPTGGFQVISRLKKYKIPILIDSKLKDVPHVLLSTAKSYVAHGANAITCWADIGPDAIKFLIDNLKDQIEIVVLTALTSLPYDNIESLAKKNILTSVSCGCKYIQVPGNFPELIKWARKNIPKEVMILSCGVGAQGGIIGEAIKCGAGYEIIGRKLLDSFDDDEMTMKFNNAYKVIHEAI